MKSLILIKYSYKRVSPCRPYLEIWITKCYFVATLIATEYIMMLLQTTKNRLLVWERVKFKRAGEQVIGGGGY